MEYQIITKWKNFSEIRVLKKPKNPLMFDQWIWPPKPFVYGTSKGWFVSSQLHTRKVLPDGTYPVPSNAPLFKTRWEAVEYSLGIKE